MMSKLSFGVLTYLNCLPVTLALEEGRVGSDDLTVERGVPEELNRKMSGGKLDVSVVSTAEYLRNRELYTRLEGFGLWCDGPVESVCLYSKYSRDELLREPGLIGVTPESATSVALAEILLDGAPTEPFGDLDEARDGIESGRYRAVLLIGDRSLEPPHWTAQLSVHDLGEWWKEKTGHPMVYAVWIARRGLDAEQIEVVRSLLGRSLDLGRADPQRVLEEGCRRSGLTAERLASYYGRLHYRTDPASEAGLLEFQERFVRGCKV